MFTRAFVLCVAALAILSPVHVTLAQEEMNRRVQQVHQAIGEGKLDEARRYLDAAIDQLPKPESDYIRSLHFDLSTAFQRLDRPLDAAQQIEQYMEWSLERDGTIIALDTLADALIDGGKPDEALAQVDYYCKRAQERPGHFLQYAVRTKVLVLARLKRFDEASPIVEGIIAEARQAFAANPSRDNALILANAFELRRDFLRRAHSPKLAKAQQEYIDFLSQQLDRENLDRNLLLMYWREQSALIAGEIRDKSENAERRWTDLKRLMTSLEGSTAPGVPSEAAAFQSRLKYAESELDAERKRGALIGREAIPFPVVSWANGPPISNRDLKGKVVLLVFRSWWGPAVESLEILPELRDWYQRFHDHGLEIISFVQHDNLEWDDVDKRLMRVNNLATNWDDNQWIVSFAQHHNLQHRIAVVRSEGPIVDAYAGSTIVLIDRNGRIRMLRADWRGGGFYLAESLESNVCDLEQMIETLLAEGSDTGG